MTTDLDAIRAALAAATPGPWEHVSPHRVVNKGDQVIAQTGDVWTRDDMQDAHLIAHAPEWLAALADEVERLREAYAETVQLMGESNDALVGNLRDTKAERDRLADEVETLRARLADLEADDDLTFDHVHPSVYMYKDEGS